MLKIAGKIKGNGKGKLKNIKNFACGALKVQKDYKTLITIRNFGCGMFLRMSKSKKNTAGT